MAHRITSRTRARKRAVDTVFEADQRGELSRDGLLDLLGARLRITAAQTPLPDYAIQIVEGVAERINQIDELLAIHTTARDFDRLPAVDRAVLRVATWEILWNDDVPPVTAIDEAVTMAKDISTDDSPGLVNAILDSVRKNASDIHESDDALAAALAPRDDESDSLDPIADDPIGSEDAVDDLDYGEADDFGSDEAGDEPVIELSEDGSEEQLNN